MNQIIAEIRYPHIAPITPQPKSTRAREIMIQELRGYGVKVLDWKPATPLTQILLEARNY